MQGLDIPSIVLVPTRPTLAVSDYDGECLMFECSELRCMKHY